VEDGVLDPKEYLISRLSAAKIPYTRAVAEAAAQNLDFGTVTARCPGFVDFRRKVENGGAIASDSPRGRRIII